MIFTEAEARINKLMDHLSGMPEAEALELWELKGICRKLVRKGWMLDRAGKPAGGVKYEATERTNGEEAGDGVEGEKG